MAAIAEAGADLVIVTDDNPRGEDGDAIVADIVAGFSRPAAVVVESDRRKANARAVGEAGAADIVLIAGKGHEHYQDVAGGKHPFDRSEDRTSETKLPMRTSSAGSCLKKKQKSTSHTHKP